MSNLSTFVKRLRDERRFDSREALMAQLLQDRDEAQSVLNCKSQNPLIPKL